MAGAPSFAVTTRLVARALGVSGDDLRAGLRTATLADLPTLLALRAAERGGPCAWDDAAYLPWRYRLGRADAGFGEAWVLEVAGRLLGIVGTEDLACRVDGVQHHGLRTMDLLVHADARSAGLGAWLNQALFERTGFVLVVGANESSRGIVQRLFQPLPPMHTYTHPVAFGQFAQRAGLRVRPMAPLAFVADQLGAAWRLGVRVLNRRGVAVRALEQLDAGSAVAGPFELHAADLQPRLMGNPRTRYLAWGAFRGELRVGHLVARISPHPRGGVDVHVADLAATGPLRATALKALLAHALGEAAARRCVSLRLTLQEQGLDSLLMRLGLFRVRRSATLFVGVHAQEPALLAALLAAPWALTERIDDNDGFH